jgi:DNA primase catalytic core
MATGLKDAVSQLNGKSDIVDVARRLGMELVEAGSEKKALCLFHTDTKPSLVLYNRSNENHHYHCYACGAHGDVFALIQKHEDCDFKAAVSWLSQVYGVDYRSRPLGFSRTQMGAFKDPNAFELALRIYRSESGENHLMQWLNDRQLSKNIAKVAELVAAKPRSLISWISQQKDSRSVLGQLADVKLLIPTRRVNGSEPLFEGPQNDYREFYFESRILFPIRDHAKELIGFAGRLIENLVGSDSPKYLYSPGLGKSQILYREYVAVELLKSYSTTAVGLSDQCFDLYICEGLVDALRLESLGMAAVALLGANASKEQILRIGSIAEQFDGRLTCHIFLDRDRAGMQGASKLAIALAHISIDATFVWPMEKQLADLGVPEGERKDPDSILKCLDKDDTVQHIELWKHSTGLAVISLTMGEDVKPDSLIGQNDWDDLSLSLRYRAATKLARTQNEAEFLLQPPRNNPVAKTEAWHIGVQRFRDGDVAARGEVLAAQNTLFINEIDARLQNARELAKSGSRRGELPTDDAAWRRLESGAVSFNVGLRELLSRPIFKPIEVFDAIMVARSFNENEGRLKVMPAPEDLVLQQYMLSDLLTDRFDGQLENERFSKYIPAVRFYRESALNETTGEDKSFDRHSETLSFAYQIDMDVLEGRVKATNQGVFRPYIECWQDFNKHLRNRAESFGELYVIRLDVKRYYDRLSRTVVRDALVNPICKAIEVLKNSEQVDKFVPDFSASRQNLPESIVDWLCDQSFDFEYYHPNSGAIEKSTANLGIPQGPTLSAWLGTIALFPLDSAIREQLKIINDELPDEPQAAYARYVDDIFILAKNQAVLQRLRSVAEDLGKALRLELLPKGKLYPRMSSAEFATLLAEGKVFTGSGPARAVEVMHLGDGATGNETWMRDDIKRASALQLLSDRRLYTASDEQLTDQLYTALAASDLRPAELPKVARWIWYCAAAKTNPGKVDLWSKYWKHWMLLTAGVNWTLDPELRPWDDPVLYALDGLEMMLSSANIYDSSFPAELFAERQRRLIVLANEVLDDSFLIGFLTPKINAEFTIPIGAGRGARKSLRTFTQRCIYIRWVATKLLGKSSTPLILPVMERSGVVFSNQLKSSLTRALITDHETHQAGIDIQANQGASANYGQPHRAQFTWLHKAITLFGHPFKVTRDDSDPVSEIKNELSFSDPNTQSDFSNVLTLLAGHSTDPSIEIKRKTLSTLLAICGPHIRSKVLQNRSALVNTLFGSQLLPLPPGIETKNLLSIKDVEPIDISDSSLIQQLVSVEFDASGFTSYDMRRQDVVWVVPAENSHFPSLRVSDGKWTSSANKIFRSPPSAILNIQASHLRWAAKAFEDLAQFEAIRRGKFVTDHTEISNETESVLAWPYVAFSEPPETTNAGNFDSLSFAPIGFLADVKQLSNFAFARDGSDRLKAYPVPLADAWLWRIGFAVTDLLGLSGELDRYHKVESVESLQELHAADYVLHSMLRRLRGDFARSAHLPRHQVQSHLPGTVVRALDILKKFPEDADNNLGLAFALGVEIETRAMELRLNETWLFDQPGAACCFAEKLTTQTILRLPIAWSNSLPTFEVSPVEIRKSVQVWNGLHKRFSDFRRMTPAIATVPNIKPSWEILFFGLRLASLKAWIRSLVFELETAGGFLLGAPDDLPLEWALNDAETFRSKQFSSLGELYSKAVNSNGSLKLLSDVTPIGWLVILTHKINLYADGDSKLQISPTNLVTLKSSITNVAKFLCKSIPSEQSTGWPFEIFGNNLEPRKIENDYLKAIETLELLEQELGFSVRTVTSAVWGIKQSSDKFVDSVGGSWLLTRMLVDQIPNERTVESSQKGRSVVFSWSETRDQKNQLVGVSVLGEKFAALSFGSSEKTGKDATPEKTDINTLNSVDELLRPPQAPASDVGDVFGNQISQGSKSALIQENELKDIEKILQKEASGGKSKVPTNGEEESVNLKNWSSKQSTAWRRRSNKAVTHNRIAYLQFRVDESYSHPLKEIGIPNELEAALLNDAQVKTLRLKREALLAKHNTNEPTKEVNEVNEVTKSEPNFDFARAITSCPNNESLWTESAEFASWAEHRRRRILEKAICACVEFGVEVLVLPEYSVRPDTILWLKDFLKNKTDKFAILAGTYRLFGSKSDLYYSDLHNAVLGEFERGDVSSNSAMDKLEKSSILTMLQPVTISGHKHLSVFTRRKKYPSLAMGEIFNPPGKEWSPLLDLSGLVSELDSIRKTEKMVALSKEDIVVLARKCFVTERFAELVCSEIFVVTSPANKTVILGEFKRLRERFGYPSTDDTTLDNDIEQIVKSIGHSADKFDRRTLIIVPAYTTRSADYWIFGQSILLAAGITTVFCAAVSKESKGGSCFIGKSSWENSVHEANTLQNTPYCGWSRGIYFNKHTDALGQEEQALVIADIDPIYMNEGKPRPQALPVPIQLVAHLPLVECINPSSLIHALQRYSSESYLDKPDENRNKNFEKLGIYDSTEVAKVAHAINSTLPSPDILLDPISDAPHTALKVGKDMEQFFKDKRPWQNRLEYWRKNWREMPMYGEPPVLTDWLAVDLSMNLNENLPDENLPKIFVPPWGSGTE